jgi:ABC-type antimicrobial peptide transport system permease subunit
VAQPTTLEARLRRIHEQPRFSLVVLALFAGTGALLVGLGVYGVLAYTVAQQTRQIAIRMALGGERRHVLRMVFRTGSSLLAVGLAVGLCASLFTNRLLEAQLWRVSPQDPLTRLATMALVLTIGGLACWVPARRATRVQLVTALKEE